MMNFSIETLRTNSLPQSFERGEALYASGAVRKLVSAGKSFSAEVQGNYRYQQTFDLGVEPVYAACSCPFDGSGWCKHVVAVGLAIITEEDAVDDVSSTSLGVKTHDEVAAEDFYEEVFLKADKVSQDAFLRQLFVQKKEIREAFLSNQKPLEIISYKQVSEVRKAISTRLHAYAFTESNIQDYLEEWAEWEWESFLSEEDDWNNGAGRLVEIIFEPAVQHIEKALLKAVTGLIGCVEARNAHVDIESEYDYESLYDEYLELLLKKITENWNKAIITPEQGRKAVEFILDRWSFLRARKDPGAFSLSFFQPLLRTIAEDPIAAQYLLQRLEAFIADKPGVPELFIFAAKKAGKDKATLRYQKAFRNESVEAAEAWLLHNKSEDAFATAAREALEAHGKAILPFLAEHLLESDDPNLFPDTLRLRASTNESMTLYQQWRERVGQSERDIFVEEHANTFSSFYLKLLEQEKHFETIRGLAKHTRIEDLEQYLKPIRAVYPDFCFYTIRDRLAPLLQKASSRNTYRLGAELLSLAKEIPGFLDEANALITHYASMRRPSLKDELRKAGLV